MNQNLSAPAPRRLVIRAAAAIALAATIAACGSSAPASTAPTAAPSVAAPSDAPTVAPTVAPSVAPPSAPAASRAPGVDAAAGLTIGAPYTLTALPGALQQTFEQQMASGLGAFGESMTVGFRQVGGGTGISILMVMGFPSGTLNDIAYQAALAGMGSSMGATFTTETVDGVQVSNGKATAGGVAVFHDGDHMLIVISQTETETLAIAKALISASK
jgi:hypothetical protein